MGRWMPEPGYETEIFLGEHGWAPAFLDRFGVVAETSVQVPHKTRDCPTSVYLTGSEYLSEAGVYDCSLQESHTFLVPQRLLVDGIELRWLGSGTDFFESDGRLGAFASDPTGSVASLLVREDLMRSFLEQEGLALVWAVVGEKEVISGPSGWDWAGSLQFTGAFRYSPRENADDRIDGSLRYCQQFPESQSD